ncbi:MAG: Spy/CpxP family protein refolding chaperone [Burkholderiales bacterium]|nr:Spy/CpxP family protein refolding chaperone [Burkholderiales bacterium]
MRTWLRRTLLGVLGASIAFGGLAACGHRHDHHGWSKMTTEERARVRDKVIDRIAGRLELNGEQKAKLTVLAGKLEEQRTALVGQNAYPREQAKALVAGEKFDRSKAQALVNEKTAAVQAKSPEVIAALGDFYDSLNAAQQAKVRELMERRGRHGWWRS